MRIIRKKMDRAIKKLNYRYRQRADMPFWYDWEPKRYKDVLDDNSMLSIDD